MDAAVMNTLREKYTDRLRENMILAGHTSARIGGPADAVLFVKSAAELEQAAADLWKMEVPFLVLGGGSNVLVSDRGVRGVVIINRARQVTVHDQVEPPTVYAESGATLNNIAQRAVQCGMAGFEWAASIPGSLGGAVYGNAGAFGGDMAGALLSVDVYHRERGHEQWPVEKLEYGYRTSTLKRNRQPLVILGATIKLHQASVESILAIMSKNSEQRRRSQPPGASLGSMFKNPPDDKAGRLLEAAGLKGTRIGGAQVSPVHANFFINTDQTSAADMKALLDLARETVQKKFGVALESEIELIGEW